MASGVVLGVILLFTVAQGFTMPWSVVDKRSSTMRRNMVLVTPPSKYPTQRGSPVDSRKIVTDNHLQAIRLNHILFASEELARASLVQLRSSSYPFDEMAQQISNCAETRAEGGSIGWVTVTTPETNTKPTTGVEAAKDVNEHLDLLLPPEARNQVLQQNTKVQKTMSCCLFSFVHCVCVL